MYFFFCLWVSISSGFPVAHFNVPNPTNWIFPSQDIHCFFSFACLPHSFFIRLTPSTILSDHFSKKGESPSNHHPLLSKDARLPHSKVPYKLSLLNNRLFSSVLHEYEPHRHRVRFLIHFQPL